MEFFEKNNLRKASQNLSGDESSNLKSKFFRQAGLQQQFQGATDDDKAKAKEQEYYRVVNQAEVDSKKYFPLKGNEDVVEKSEILYKRRDYVYKVAERKVSEYSRIGKWWSGPYVKRQENHAALLQKQSESAYNAWQDNIKNYGSNELAKDLKEKETEELGKQKEKETEELKDLEAEKTELAKDLDAAQTANKKGLAGYEHVLQIKQKQEENRLAIELEKERARAKAIETTGTQSAAALSELGFGNFSKQIANAMNVAGEKTNASNGQILQAGIIVDIYQHAMRPDVFERMGDKTFSDKAKALNPTLGNIQFGISDLPDFVPGADVFVHENNNRLNKHVLFFFPNGDQEGGERAFGQKLKRIKKIDEWYSDGKATWFNIELEDGTMEIANNLQLMAKVQSGADYYIREEDALSMEKHKLVNRKTANWMDSLIGFFILKLCGGNERKALAAMDAFNAPGNILEKIAVIFGIIKDKTGQYDEVVEASGTDEYFSGKSGPALSTTELSSARNVLTSALQQESNGEILVTKEEAKNIKTAFKNNFQEVLNAGNAQGVENWDFLTHSLFRMEDTKSNINITEFNAQKALFESMAPEEIDITVRVPASRGRRATTRTEKSESIVFTPEELTKIRDAFNNDPNYAKQLGASYGIQEWDILVDAIFADTNPVKIGINKKDDPAFYQSIVDARTKLSGIGFIH